MGNFSELDMYLFGQATHYDIYKKLGAHPQIRRNKRESVLQFMHLMPKKCLSLGNLMNGMKQNMRWSV